MTQQPFYPPQYPQAPQQGYPQQVQQPYPPQGYPQQPSAPQGYAQPAYPAPGPPPAQPTQPLAQGSLDDYFSQPSAASGPSISWSNADRSQKPIGTYYAGIVARDVTHADVQQQTDFNTKAPLTYRDGRPRFAMKVPLKVQPSAEFPDGEATWYVKGQARDELVRAMSEAGAEGAPRAGAGIVITLVGRRPRGAGLNPANVVQVRYSPPAGSGAPSPAPEPQQVQPPVQQTVQPPAPQQGQQFAGVEQVVQQAPAPQVSAPQQPYGQVFAPVEMGPGPAVSQPGPAVSQPGPAVSQPGPAVSQPGPAVSQPHQQFQQPLAPQAQQGAGVGHVMQQAPAPQIQQAPQAQQQAPAPQPPSDLSPEQQALLAKLTGG